MGAEYVKGQRVRLAYVDKYERTEFAKYAGKTGKVVDSYWYSMSGWYRPIAGVRPSMRDYYCYTIRLDKDASKIKGVPEDALESVE
ncbi:MAG: hypothetical protein Q8O05_01425 [Chloroflexota bacterium]|nr:hypothetical protein [Chloroflexota bacterium]